MKDRFFGQTYILALNRRLRRHKASPQACRVEIAFLNVCKFHFATLKYLELFIKYDFMCLLK